MSGCLYSAYGVEDVGASKRHTLHAVYSKYMCRGNFYRFPLTLKALLGCLFISRLHYLYTNELMSFMSFSFTHFSYGLSSPTSLCKVIDVLLEIAKKLVDFFCFFWVNNATVG